MKSVATEKILDLFDQLNQIPRCSNNEAGVCAWLIGIAEKNRFSYAKDGAGNLVIRIPASQGYENSPIIILQGHMDMVCEKTDDSRHDFSKDPIKSVEKGEWLYADQTTLGADNGAAIAMALAVALDPAIPHPPLELLFTVREEVGLWGVKDLKPEFLNGRILLNLDSEQEGTFVVGSAGGVTTEIKFPLEKSRRIFEHTASIQISGCRGGHSGVDAHKHFANAIKLLARVLTKISKISNLQLLDIKGGTAHNAIPRSAEAVIAFPTENTFEVNEIIVACQKDFVNEFMGSDPEIKIRISPASLNTGLSEQMTLDLIQVLMAYPSGVDEMSAKVNGFVETSSNLASITLKDEHIEIMTSQRSVVMSKLEEITDRIFSISALAGGKATIESEYVSWEPNMNSQLLAVSKQAYQRLFGREPIVEMIHAGLECSVIGDIYPGMDVISMGVTIENPHSPTERMHIPSIGKVWRLLLEILADYKS